MYLDDIDPDTIRVELYADEMNDERPLRYEMARGRQLIGANAYVYHAEVPSTRPASDYTARVIPYFPGVSVPLETIQILWQR